MMQPSLFLSFELSGGISSLLFGRSFSFTVRIVYSHLPLARCMPPPPFNSGMVWKPAAGRFIRPGNCRTIGSMTRVAGVLWRGKSSLPLSLGLNVLRQLRFDSLRQVCWNTCFWCVATYFFCFRAAISQPLVRRSGCSCAREIAEE
jgi:hypothetical protein